MNKLQQLISRHTTQWFHRVGMDESSPALLLSEVSTRILEYFAHKQLSLTISENAFRKYMCEFLCTYYIAGKKGVPWQGPLTKQSRPWGWTSENEEDWREYLIYNMFSNEFWHSFWSQFPEAIWETKVPRWRDSFQWIVLHYINVQPEQVEFQEEESDTAEEDME